MVIVWSMGPYSCRLCRMCCAYADCGLLYLIYVIYVPGNGALGSASLPYICQFAVIAGQFVYSTFVVVWCVIVSTCFHKLANLVVAFKFRPQRVH